MQRNQAVYHRSPGVYYRNTGPVYMRSPNNPIKPVYLRERPVRWGLYEFISSVIFISLSLMFVAGIAALVLDVVGIDSLSQIYGLDQVIQHFEIETSSAG